MVGTSNQSFPVAWPLIPALLMGCQWATKCVPGLPIDSYVINGHATGND